MLGVVPIFHILFFTHIATNHHLTPWFLTSLFIEVGFWCSMDLLFFSGLGKMQSTEADSKYSAFVLFFTLSTYPSLDSTFAVTTTSVLTWRELIKIQLKDRIGFRTFILYKGAGIWYNQQIECSIVCSFLSTFVPTMFTFNLLKVYINVLRYAKLVSITIKIEQLWWIRHFMQ